VDGLRQIVAQGVVIENHPMEVLLVSRRLGPVDVLVQITLDGGRIVAVDGQDDGNRLFVVIVGFWPVISVQFLDFTSVCRLGVGIVRFIIRFA